MASVHPGPVKKMIQVIGRISIRTPRDPAVYLPVALLTVLVLIIVIPNPYLVNQAFIEAKANAAAGLILVAAGQTVVMLTGGFDLSVGGVISVTNSLAATRMTGGPLSVALWTAAIALFGIGAGALNGFIVAVMRVNSFIATLATWSIWSGLALVILPEDGGTVAPALRSVVRTHAWGVPGSVILVGLLMLWWVYFRRSRSGVQLYAVGSDERAAILSGVNLARVRIIAFSLSGLLAALAGIYRTVQVGSGSPTGGDGFILVSVAAVVIGGTRLGGGRGGVGLTVLGALILLFINDAIFFLGVGTFFTPMIQGVLLIAVVALAAVARNLQRRHP